MRACGARRSKGEEATGGRWRRWQASGPVPTETEALDRERTRMSSGSESMWVGSKRRGRSGREAPATANRHRQASKADQRTSPRRKSPWRRRSRTASGRRHRGLRAPRSASMAWALRALGLRRPPPSASQACSRPRLPDCVIGSPIESLDSEARSATRFFWRPRQSLNTTPLPSQSEVRGSRRPLARPTLAKIGRQKKHSG